MRLLLLAALFMLASLPVYAHPTYEGYSGAPGALGTCASSCHGVSGGTVQVFGFPAAYTPGESYLITVKKMSGLSIKNFNASVRRGTGSTTAGQISGGQFTGTYNVPQEPNGVHMTTLDHDSATFTWRAPAAGTGTVKLYLGSHQGPRNTGPNTARVLVSNEAVTVPDTCSQPVPSQGAQIIASSFPLTWTSGAGATSVDVYFGTVEDPPFVLNTTASNYTPAESLLPGTAYYWRVDARNEAGVTTGPVWHFSTMARPGAPSAPQPVDMATGVPVTTALLWTAGEGSAVNDVHFGTVNPPPLAAANLATNGYDPAGDLQPGTTYYWRVVARNAAGETASPVWEFRTEPPNAAEDSPGLPTELALGPVYPNPFNAVVTISFALPQSMPATLDVFDVTGRQIATLSSGMLSAGTHQMQWSAANVGTGVYLLRLNAGGRTITHKIVALK